MSLISRDSLFDLDNFFDRVWSPMLSREEHSDFFSPRVDVKENTNSFLISADLPGVKKEDVTITLENGVLTIEAKSQQEKTEEQAGEYIRKERRSGTYMRSFNLGSDLKDVDVDASFKDGVLRLEIPKVEKAVSEPKRIEIH